MGFGTADVVNVSWTLGLHGLQRSLSRMVRREREREEKVGNITGGTGDEHRRSETLNLPFRPILMCVCVYGSTANGLLIQDHPMQKRTHVST